VIEKLKDRINPAVFLKNLHPTVSIFQKKLALFIYFINKRLQIQKIKNNNGYIINNKLA